MKIFIFNLIKNINKMSIFLFIYTKSILLTLESNLKIFTLNLTLSLKMAVHCILIQISGAYPSTMLGSGPYASHCRHKATELLDVGRHSR